MKIYIDLKSIAIVVISGWFKRLKKTSFLVPYHHHTKLVLRKEMKVPFAVAPRNYQPKANVMK